MAQITWQEFDKIEMRVGKILEVSPFPEAHAPSYLLQIDFGPDGGLVQSAAALADDYARDELVGRFVVAVTNFPPKQIGPHMSHALVLAAQDGDGALHLLQPDGAPELGARIR